jgi:hypothetical protein
MGASTWEYITPYAGSVGASLEALHTQIFQQKYGDTGTYRSLAELHSDHDFMGEEGTHSILDIQRVIHVTDAPDPDKDEDYNTMRPLAPDRTAHWFGTGRPTVGHFQAQLAAARHANSGYPLFEKTLLDECRMRRTGIYVILHTEDQPTHVGIFGYSGD